MDETVRVYTPKNKRIQYDKVDESWTDTMEEKSNKAIVKAKELASHGVFGLTMAKFSKPVKDERKKKKVSEARKMAKHEKPVKNTDYKKKSYFETFQEVFEERRVQESYMRFRHPWFDVVYNWIVGISIVALFIGFAWWGIGIRNDRKEASIRAKAYAEWAAEQEKEAQEKMNSLLKEEEEKKNSEEYIEGVMSIALAKMYYGIKNFQDKYHYTEADFETYGRCAYNRMLNSGYSNDFEEVVFQEGQFLNCNENNPSNVEPYIIMAKNHVHKWRTETVAPISSDYVYAELTPNGVYLKNQFNADGYAIRWRAS